MVVDIAFTQANLSDRIVDVVTAGFRDFTERPYQIADSIAFVGTVICDHLFGHITTAGFSERIDIGRIRAALTCFSRGNHPEPRTRNFILGIGSLCHNKKCYETCEPYCEQFSIHENPPISFIFFQTK